MSARPWTEAHIAEGHRALCGVAGELTPAQAKWMLGNVRRASKSERLLREALVSVNDPRNPINADTIVARVRGLADDPPRLIREVTWRGQSGEEHATREEAIADKSHGGDRLTRITRIRRAR